MEEISVLLASDFHISNDSSKDVDFESAKTDFIAKIKLIIGEKIIVIAGDLFHDKDKTTSDAITKAVDLMNELLSLGNVITINGNHDVNERNPSKNSPMNTLATIYKNCDRYHYLTENAVYEHKNIPSFIKFVLTDRFSKKVTEFERQNDVLYVALYHGAFKNYHNFVKSGFTINDFDSYDLVMAGDIHRKHVINKKIYYASSLMQLTHGENYTHGFFHFKITMDETSIHVFPPKHIRVKCRKCYANFLIKNDALILDTDDKTKIEDLHEYEEIDAVLKFKTTDVEKAKTFQENLQTMFQNKINVKMSQIAEQIGEQMSYRSDNLFDLIDKANEKIFTPEDIEKCILLRQKLVQDKIIHMATNLSTIILGRLTFSHITCYDENNDIDITNYKKQILGITAPNDYGKTSIIKTIAFAIYGNKRVFGMLSSNHNTGCTNIELFKDNEKYIIHRTIERGAKQMNNTLEVTKINRDGTTTILSESNKDNTEQKIELLFGDYLTILENNISFINANNNFLSATSHGKKLIIDKTFNLDVCTKICSYLKTQINKKNDEKDVALSKIKETFLRPHYTQKITNYLIQKKLYDSLFKPNTAPRKNAVQKQLLLTDVLNNEDLLKIIVEIRADTQQKLEITETEINHERCELNTINKELQTYEDLEGEDITNPIDDMNDILDEIDEIDEQLNVLHDVVVESHAIMADNKNKKNEIDKKIKAQLNEQVSKLFALKKQIVEYADSSLINNIDEQEQLYNTNIKILQNETQFLLKYKTEFELNKAMQNYKTNELLLKTLNNNCLLNCSFSTNCDYCKNNKTLIETQSVFEQKRNLESEIEKYKDIHKCHELFYLNKFTTELKTKIDEHHKTKTIIGKNATLNVQIKQIENMIQTLTEEQQENLIKLNAIENQMTKYTLTLTREHKQKEYLEFEVMQSKFEKIEHRVVNCESLKSKMADCEENLAKNNAIFTSLREDIILIDKDITIIKEYMNTVNKCNETIDDYNKQTSYYTIEMFYDSVLSTISAKCNQMLREIGNEEICLKYINSKHGDIVLENNYGRDCSTFSSSAEFITNIVMRIALASLHKSINIQYFIVDEGFTTICENILNKKSKIIFNFLKEHFTHILMVSHLPTIKGSYEELIGITHIDNESHVQFPPI